LTTRKLSSILQLNCILDDVWIDSMYVPRTIESFVSAATKQFPVLLVTGARQVGKTTLLKHIAQADRTYVTLDDPLVLTLAKEDPALFLQRFRPSYPPRWHCLSSGN